MHKLRPFHLAVPVHNLEKARWFYGTVMGFDEGRSSEHWIDYNFYGHQFVVHLDDSMKVITNHSSNSVDGHNVPIPHFGVVLSMQTWKDLADKLMTNNMDFIIAPHIRFRGESGEQATMFFQDPSGNALEFKAFKDLNMLFAK